VERLFSTKLRRDRSVIRPGETQYEFLDRTGMEPFARLRDLLERWFSDLPIEQRAEFRRRFTSKDERHSLAAFWELYLYASMRTAGYQVDFHPDTPEGKGHPDFLVKTKEETFYLEATLVAASDAERASLLREAKLQAAIDEHISSPNFFLELTAEISAGPEPSITRLKPSIEDWLQQLDPDAVYTEAQKWGWCALPAKEWRADTWSIELTAIPKRPEERGMDDGKTIGIVSSGVDWVDDVGHFREAVAKKAKRYGMLDHPMIIAVLCDAFCIDDDMVDQALFGEHQAIVGYDGNKFVLTPTRGNRALWRFAARPVNRRVSGLLVGMRINPFRNPASMVERTPKLWMNPWATRPVGKLVWASRRLRKNTGDWIDEAGVPISDLLGVAPGWPYETAIEGKE
jgi:hypothetical protein